MYVFTGIFGYEVWKGTYAYGFEFRWLFLAAVYGMYRLSSIGFWYLKKNENVLILCGVHL